MNQENLTIRSWQESDRHFAAEVIGKVLAEYGLQWEPTGADRDVLEIEDYYLKTGGEFWVVELQGQIVGTAAYYPITKGNRAVEIRKMYLLPSIRGRGVGKFLLEKLESAIAAKGFKEIWIETASVLKEAVNLYESNGYQPLIEVETKRCDRAYIKFLNNNQ
jgi:putative acetyltransferase